MANIFLRVIDIVYIAVKAAIYSVIAFTIIRCSIISAFKELKKQKII